MGQVKTIKSRIQFKTDTLENWENFIPERGELCICSDFVDTGLVNKKGNKIYKPGLKIGTNGNTSFNSLPFLSEEYITNEKILSLFDSIDHPNSVLGNFILGTSTLGRINITNILDEAFLDLIILD